MENKIMNRWFVVVGAVLIQLALGAIYAWSAFTKSLTEAPYSFTTPQTQAIFYFPLNIHPICYFCLR
jgi:OFA family oxalate/formate antiporter-like MFS transporter